MSIFHPPVPPIFIGANAGQPYAPSYVPEFPAFQADQPPFTNNIARAHATAVALWQPDPWVYDYLGPVGGAQPYGTQKLAPSIGATPVFNPPFTTGGPIVMQAIAVALAQPDPWQYNDESGAAGGLQPYGQRILNPAISSVPVFNPPFTLGGPYAILHEIVGLNVKDYDTLNPWSYRFFGRLQPYEPIHAIISTIAVPVFNPQFSQRASTITAEIYSLTQPDQWVYSYAGTPGGEQPYGARHLNPATPGMSIDKPPPVSIGRNPGIVASITATAQPDSWVYLFQGASQPYGFTHFSAARPEINSNVPPFAHAGRSVVYQSIVGFWQPEPWPYVFIEYAAQPYGDQLKLPVPVANFPPAFRFLLDNQIVAVNLNQPDAWTYNFLGGMGPFVPRPLNPIYEGIIPPPPGAGKKPSVTGIYPEPAWDKKPNKPASFRPIWDVGAKVEQPKPVVIEPGPVPLPPLSIYGAAPQQAPAAPVNAANPLNLPTHNHLVPPDPVGLGHRMQEAQDLSDAIAVLRALGLIK